MRVAEAIRAYSLLGLVGLSEVQTGFAEFYVRAYVSKHRPEWPTIVHGIVNDTRPAGVRYIGCEIVLAP